MFSVKFKKKDILGTLVKSFCFLTEKTPVLPAVRLAFFFFNLFFLACLVTARVDKPGEERQLVAISLFLERDFCNAFGHVLSQT